MVKEVPRTAKEIIDQAIEENKWNERLLYFIAVVCVISGVTALIFGLIKEQGVVAIAGGIASALFIPAMYQARQIRRAVMRSTFATPSNAARKWIVVWTGARQRRPPAARGAAG